MNEHYNRFVNTTYLVLEQLKFENNRLRQPTKKYSHRQHKIVKGYNNRIKK